MDNNGLPAVAPLSGQWLDFFIVAGSVALVVLAAFFWAIFLRKGGKRKRIRRHRRHRRINPTLADEGGLPPVREEGKSSDQPPP